MISLLVLLVTIIIVLLIINFNLKKEHYVTKKVVYTNELVNNKKYIILNFQNKFKNLLVDNISLYPNSNPNIVKFCYIYTYGGLVIDKDVKMIQPNNDVFNKNTIYLLFDNDIIKLIYSPKNEIFFILLINLYIKNPNKIFDNTISLLKNIKSINNNFLDNIYDFLFGKNISIIDEYKNLSKNKSIVLLKKYKNNIYNKKNIIGKIKM